MPVGIELIGIILICILANIGGKAMHNQNAKKRLLVAGHDLKFIGIILDYLKERGKYDICIDNWKNHSEHDMVYSQKCLNWADIIFCEWGLGNAVWYSRNKLERQKLIIRVHRQELVTNYPENYTIDNIDKIVTVSPIIKKDIMQKINIPEDKVVVIYNVIDAIKLNKPKIEDSKYNIGMLGYSPKIKRIDRALEIFDNVWRVDNKYKLYIKGMSPQQYTWLWSRKEEREYYENVFYKIKKSDCSKNIIFENWSEDKEEWFKKIGYILSVSDFESFHLAVAEGMASGSIPIILYRPGAEDLFPKKFIFKNIEDAARYIIRTLNQENIEENRNYVKEYSTINFDKSIVCKQIEEILEI